MKVTEEQVENAKAAYAKADAETVAAYAKASVAAEEAWKKYLKLWREYENGN